MEIHNIEIKQRLDKTSSEEVQDLDISFVFNQGNKEYTADVTGQAFIKNKVVKEPKPDHNEIEVSIMLNEYYTYHNSFNVPLFTTDMEEDELLEILKKHCT